MSEALYCVSCETEKGLVPGDFGVYYFGLIPRKEADIAFIGLVERVKQGLEVRDAFHKKDFYTITKVKMHRTFDHDIFEKVCEWDKSGKSDTVTDLEG